MLGIEVIGKGNKDTLSSSMDAGPPPGGPGLLQWHMWTFMGAKSDVGRGLIPQ